ncbi:MAG: type II toxin-antitoxin system VapC family toxin [Spirochaetaceae bacterium]|nr:MAG: type II toxin-antitoxin system VapC family toxin [Spirochaetaceae bacterium]
MNVLFDTSVLVPALVDQLANHPACFSALIRGTSDGNRGVCSTHALVECYSVLTSLPVRRRITAPEARRLVEESILPRFTVVALDTEDYRSAIRIVAESGLSGGIIYDALHLAAARKEGCDRILTYNLRHFNALCPAEITVSAP